MGRFVSSTRGRLQNLEDVRRRKGAGGGMEVKFIVYDPCVSYFNLEIASFIEVLNGISSDHLGQNTLLHEKKLCAYKEN